MSLFRGLPVALLPVDPSPLTHGILTSEQHSPQARKARVREVKNNRSVSPSSLFFAFSFRLVEEEDEEAKQKSSSRSLSFFSCVAAALSFSLALSKPTSTGRAGRNDSSSKRKENSRTTYSTD